MGWGVCEWRCGGVIGVFLDSGAHSLWGALGPWKVDHVMQNIAACTVVRRHGIVVVMELSARVLWQEDNSSGVADGSP